MMGSGGSSTSGSGGSSSSIIPVPHPKHSGTHGTAIGPDSKGGRADHLIRDLLLAILGMLSPTSDIPLRVRRVCRTWYHLSHDVHVSRGYQCLTDRMRGLGGPAPAPAPAEGVGVAIEHMRMAWTGVVCTASTTWVDTSTSSQRYVYVPRFHCRVVLSRYSFAHCSGDGGGGGGGWMGHTNTNKQNTKPNQTKTDRVMFFANIVAPSTVDGTLHNSHRPGSCFNSVIRREANRPSH